MELAERKPITLMPDLSRVFCQFFDLDMLGKAQNIIERINALKESVAAELLDTILHEFNDRHQNLPAILKQHYLKAVVKNPQIDMFSEKKKLLLGAYFSNEYTPESAALMNPSMVVHSEDKNPDKEICSFVMSLRSVGEGHISSIQFRTGNIDQEGSVIIDPLSGYISTGKTKSVPGNNGERTELAFKNVRSISERIIFPITADEKNGIEDVRLVKFETDSYYGTYTAYDGHKITLKLIITEDFKTFFIEKLMDGSFSHKGLALFPRKIDGNYVMTSRQDGMNLYIMHSDDLLKWEKAYKIIEPKEPWEYIQLGNCGSPLEIDQGWILITHGVGPMRKYVIVLVYWIKLIHRK